jgi:DNA-binding transcriptional MerR regulator
LSELKSDGAFRTIGELSAELGVPQHVLRYWEGRFPQLRPLTRAGNRRYYRPDDVMLVKTIHKALNQDGFTIKGVQKLLRGPAIDRASPIISGPSAPNADDLLPELLNIRDTLRAALAK